MNGPGTGGETDAAERPVLLFDVNGTLSDTGALATAFAEEGLDPLLARLWFASILRDGIAVTAAGGVADFSELAADLLPPLLEDVALQRPLGSVVEALTGALGALPPREDVRAGLRALSDAGFRLAALTNGSTGNAERVLTEAGALDRFQAVLSVQDLGGWKPSARSYLGAADLLGVDAPALMLVAAHPWDLNGAAAVGLRTAWIRREDTAYPTAMRRPELTVDGLLELADVLDRLEGR